MFIVFSSLSDEKIINVTSSRRYFFWFFDKSSEVNKNLGVPPSLSVGGRAIRHSLHSAIATLRSNNTYYPLRKGRTITRQKNEQSRDLSKNLFFFFKA